MILDIIKEKIGNISVSAGDKSYTLDMLKLRRVKLDMRERSCLFNFAFPFSPTTVKRQNFERRAGGLSALFSKSG